MMRVSIYVDGFNVYHGVEEHCPEYLWLSYRALAEVLTESQETIQDVYYFTAVATWKSRKAITEHEHFILAQKSVDVKVVRGRFQKQSTECHLCHRFYTTHVEKRTDVNIAVQVMEDAFGNRFDKAWLVSADSDLLPIIGAVKRLAPDKLINVMFPIGRNSYDLRQTANAYRKMKRKHLARCQFPDRITYRGMVLGRPADWPKPAGTP